MISEMKPITSEHSKITVGIVTYNSSSHIEPCLQSIMDNLSDAAPAFIVLDNASSDHTVEILKKFKRNYPHPIHIITQNVNHGYAWGANRIAELAESEWLCLINPDARILTPVYKHAREIVRRYPTCGVIGGILIDPDGNPQECGGVFPTPQMAIWDWCGLRSIFPRPQWRTTLKFDHPEDSPAFRIDYPTGAFWLLRHEVYQRVGPFDERFFLYFEETDFCMRAKEKGWTSYIHPGIRIEHHRGASTQQNDDVDQSESLSVYFESLTIYLYKHFPEWKVRLSLNTIHNALKFKRWIRKDDKSEMVLKAFESGLLKSMDKNNTGNNVVEK